MSVQKVQLMYLGKKTVKRKGKSEKLPKLRF